MEKLAILDCGGQYTKVIDRKVRELGVKSDIFPINVSAEKLKEYKSIILSGGPNNVGDQQRLKFDVSMFDLNIPILGICYGMQLMSDYFGGTVDSNIKKEYGQNEIKIDTNSPIFEGLSETQSVLMSHGDTVKNAPEGFKVIAMSGEKVIAGISNEEKRLYGLQFHPEVDLTVEGMKILENFIRKIAEYKEFYALEDRIQTSIKQIQEKVKDNNVVVLVSGGVDSAVTTALLIKALKPENIYAIHVDTGLMRKDESDIICENLKQLGLKNLFRENAKDIFFNTKVTVGGKEIGPLVETYDPEQKRQIIGELFIVVVNKVIERLGLDPENTFIAQGTLRPDLIESGNPDISSYAHKIKTHHNDVEIIRKAREKGLIVETNSDWHKDEVRKVARMLGLEESVAERQPFPGPGLAVRLLCHDVEDQAIVQESDLIKISEIVDKTNQKGYIVPIKSVGVQGDARSYKNLALIAGKKADFDWKATTALSKEITDDIQTINRVGYILNKETIDGEIKCNQMTINDENVELLRELDKIVTDNLNSKKISQAFAVLIPVGITKKYSVSIRTFVTSDFMTGRPAIIGVEEEKEVINKIVDEIMEKFSDKIEFVIYDITSKPPATCEWQ